MSILNNDSVSLSLFFQIPCHSCTSAARILWFIYSFHKGLMLGGLLKLWPWHCYKLTKTVNKYVHTKSNVSFLSCTAWLIYDTSENDKCLFFGLWQSHVADPYLFWDLFYGHVLFFVGLQSFSTDSTAALSVTSCYRFCQIPPDTRAFLLPRSLISNSDSAIQTTATSGLMSRTSLISTLWVV